MRAVRQAQRATRWSRSHLEDLRVAPLDLLGALLDAFGILLHQLDLRQRANARFFLGLVMGGILAGGVDDHLLPLAPVHPVLEQARGVGIWRPLEPGTWAWCGGLGLG